MNLITTLYYINLFLIPFGLIIRTYDVPGGHFSVAVGLFGIIVYFLARIIKRLTHGDINYFERGFEILLILMSVTHFSRYLFYSFWDIPGIITVVFFIVMTISAMYLRMQFDHKIITVSILYTLLLIPLFGMDYYLNPRDLIPFNWYDVYQIL